MRGRRQKREEEEWIGDTEGEEDSKKEVLIFFSHFYYLRCTKWISILACFLIASFSLPAPTNPTKIINGIFFLSRGDI